MPRLPLPAALPPVPSVVLVLPLPALLPPVPSVLAEPLPLLPLPAALPPVPRVVLVLPPPARAAAGAERAGRAAAVPPPAALPPVPRLVLVLPPPARAPPGRACWPSRCRCRRRPSCRRYRAWCWSSRRRRCCRRRRSSNSICGVGNRGGAGEKGRHHRGRSDFIPHAVFSCVWSCCCHERISAVPAHSPTSKILRRLRWSRLAFRKGVAKSPSETPLRLITSPARQMCDLPEVIDFRLPIRRTGKHRPIARCPGRDISGQENPDGDQSICFTAVAGLFVAGWPAAALLKASVTAAARAAHVGLDGRQRRRLGRPRTAPAARSAPAAAPRPAAPRPPRWGSAPSRRRRPSRPRRCDRRQRRCGRWRARDE